MSANFIDSVNSPMNFRFWCQKVLPLVYDDSLSYYELLCKVVDYLNKTMSDVATLVKAYTDLEEYVNNYFDNLDVQEEINNKLDVMAGDGTLTNLIKGYVDPFIAEQIEYNEITRELVLANQEQINVIQGAMSTPLTASTVADMTDHTKIYVYTGSETGYVNGNWYYWSGSAWTSGGAYNAAAVETDKTLKISGMAADAATTGYVSDRVFTSGNVYAFMDTVENEQVASSTGVISANTTYNRTVYVPTRNAERIAFPDQDQYNPINICFYDKDKVYISGYGQSGFPSYACPPNAKYFIATMTKSGTMTRCQLVNSISEVENINHKIDLLGSAALKIKNFPHNLINVDDYVDNAYVNYAGGNIVTNESNYFCTGFIPVTAGHTYRANHGRNYAWYTSGRVYISGMAETDIQTGIVAPGNAAYIRFTVNKTTDGIDNPYLLYFADALYYSTAIDLQLSWCAGKRINWLGDSIVAGVDFDDVVIAALGLVQTAEYGINGSTIALKADGTDDRDAMCMRYDDMTDNADIIAVSGGTNDFEYAWCPIGDMSSTDNKTFYGALKNLCEGLIDKYPTKLIFFTTPIKRGQPFANGNGGTYTPDNVTLTPDSKNKYGLTLGDYGNIIKEVCAYYSIPVLDLYNESGLNPSITSQQSLFDEALTHPNTTGQKIMARRVAGWIQQIGCNIPGI